MDDWTIIVESKTTTQNGKRRIFSRRAPGYGKVARWIEAVLPPIFYGREVIIATPLHWNIGHVDPDTRRFHYDMGPCG